MEPEKVVETITEQTTPKENIPENPTATTETPAPILPPLPPVVVPTPEVKLAPLPVTQPAPAVTKPTSAVPKVVKSAPKPKGKAKPKAKAAPQYYDSESSDYVEDDGGSYDGHSAGSESDSYDEDFGDEERSNDAIHRSSSDDSFSQEFSDEDRPLKPKKAQAKAPAKRKAVSNRGGSVTKKPRK